MVEGADKIGRRQRSTTRIDYTPGQGTAAGNDQASLINGGEAFLERARMLVAAGNIGEGAFLYSQAARNFLALGEHYNRQIGEARHWGDGHEQIGIQMEQAMDHLKRSQECREKAIGLFDRVGRRLDVARDRSFLGKTLSLMGRISQDITLVQRAVFERTRALQILRELKTSTQQEADELSYLADDIRLAAKMEKDPTRKRAQYLESCGYSEEALQLFDQCLIGRAKIERRLHERSFMAEARTRAALLVQDIEEIERVRDENRALSFELRKAGVRGKVARVFSYAARLQRHLAEDVLRTKDSLARAIEFIEQAQALYSQEENTEELQHLTNDLKKLKKLLAELFPQERTDG